MRLIKQTSWQSWNESRPFAQSRHGLKYPIADGAGTVTSPSSRALFVMRHAQKTIKSEKRLMDGENND